MQINHAGTKKIFILVCLLVLFAQVVSAIVNIQLFQDGGSYLFEILQTKSPAIRHGRISVALIQLPTLFIIRILNKFFNGVNENLFLIRIVFSLSYCLIPLIALALCWAIVRKNKEQLFIWPALIILHINLVNFSGVSELLIALQFSCPLMIGAVTIPKSKFFLALLLVLLPIIFFLHPLVAGLFLIMSIGIFYAGYKNSDIKAIALKIGIGFLITAVVKFILNLYKLTEYENSFVNTKEGNSYLFETSIENKVFLLLSLLVGFVCLISKHKINFGLRALMTIRGSYLTSIIILMISGLLLITQYAYRDFPLKTGLAVFASLMMLLLLAMDSIKKIIDDELQYRFKLITAIAIIFSVVVLSKALIWQSAIEKLRESFSMNADPCIELDANYLQWLKTSPYKIINTWALPTLALIIQDHPPRKLLLEKGNCQASDRSGQVKFDEWTIIPKQYITPSLQ